MKRIISLVLALTLLFGCTAIFSSCGLEGDVAYVTDNGKIIVGITEYVPMDYLDENGEWIGFDADLAKMFAESLGVECEFVKIDWNNKIAEINSMQIDLIWNGMTVTDELGESIDFSISYAKNAQVAIVKNGSTVTKDTLAQSTVAVENGSACEKVARETLGCTDLVEKNDGQVAALSEVLSGTADVAIVDITMAENLVGKGNYAGLEVLEGATYGAEVFAVGLRKGSDLKGKLDAFLKAKYKDGTLEALAEKYGVGLNTDALK